MNSREIVKRTIEFDKPDRVPLMFPYLGISDVYDIGLKTASGWKPKEEGEKDEWGTIWEKPDAKSGIVNMGYVKSVPIEDIDEIKDYSLPVPSDPSRYEDIENEIKKSGEKYRLFGWFTLFERAQHLHGMENLFIDLYQKPEQVHVLLNKINDFTLGVLDNLNKYKGRLDGFRLGDDWGTQKGSLLSIKMFREFFKSRYKEIISKAHGLGMDVWLHSDGRINEVIEEFIEIGLDVVNIQSPHVLGIEEIRRRYSGRITFECCVDLQKSLPFKSRREIGNEARVLIEKWGTSKGGFIGTDYGTTEEDHIAIGVSKERVCWMLEAFRRYGVYR